VKASVAVVPRERFRQLSLSLRSLFQTIDASVPVFVVLGGASEQLRKELYALRIERPFEFIECEDFILPNKARNIALDRVETRYVAFCDNDLDYWPGWLDALVENAEVNGSAAVAPLILIGPTNPPRIHHAGGSFVYREDEARRPKLLEVHHYDNIPLPQAEAENFCKAPLDHKNFEYHCVLLDADAMRAVGGHDERLILHEHLDSSLRLMIAGGRLTFEPRARVMYRAFVRFKDDDWPYFLFRWALHRAKTSDEVFEGNWGGDKDGLGWMRGHRMRAMFTTLPRLPKCLNRGKIKRALLMFYQPHIMSLDTKQPDDEGPLVLPKPPTNGLEKAGIKLTRSIRAVAAAHLF
jgi:GT2 family glycosyltransferase